MTRERDELEEPVTIPTDGVELEGSFAAPRGAKGLVLFAHGSGSSRRSPRNRFVARALRERGLATLLLDLLTSEEEAEDADGWYRFDIPLLARRLGGAAEWLRAHGPAEGRLPLGLFGASTGAAAALVAAAQLPEEIHAVVARGGRPDLARASLGSVRAPTLLIVGGEDRRVLGLNCEALAVLTTPKELAIVPGATHLFEEPGALERVARLAGDWFVRHLAPELEEVRRHAHG